MACSILTRATEKIEEPATPKTADESAPKDLASTDDTSAQLPPLRIPLGPPPKLPPRPEETESGPHDMQAPPSPPKRKFTSPFSFFSRGNSKTSGISRRDTITSTASVSTANDEVESENEATPKRPNRASLRDRFKLLRMQEETGLVLDERDTSRPGSGAGDKSDSEAVFSPKEELDQQVGKPRSSSEAAIPATGGATLNESLPPGTAVGTAAGPSGDGEPVDWDLWQAVVYEGPAAVARSSADELNKAITKGIPSAIRGVVWQVLANSKNEELEVMYRELVARGEKEIHARRGSELKARPGLSRPQSIADSMRDGASSRASVHSSTSPTSPAKDSAVVSTTSQTLSSAEAALAAEQKQQREEAASLQKLERAIKRDLGSRTSYSKFIMSQGLQDGLFGICKAYALFDEEVGYAQGMNFIAMPLLFNVRFLIDPLLRAHYFYAF